MAVDPQRWAIVGTELVECLLFAGMMLLCVVNIDPTSNTSSYTLARRLPLAVLASGSFQVFLSDYHSYVDK